MPNHTLKEFRVILLETPTDHHPIAFDCQAEDKEHAQEQALNAYPTARITETHSLVDVQGGLLIHSLSEAASSGGAGFWNTSYGWTTEDGASRFSIEAWTTMSMPASIGNDASWVLALGCSDQAKRPSPTL